MAMRLYRRPGQKLDGRDRLNGFVVVWPRKMKLIKGEDEEYGKGKKDGEGRERPEATRFC